jgi:hypothetical protein
VRDGDLESFETKRETTRCGLVFIGLKLSVTTPKLEPLLIVLELISNDSDLKPLLMKVLSPAIQN